MHRNNGPPARDDVLFIESVYRRHKGIMYKIASSAAGSGAEADDIVSESVLRLFRYAAVLRDLPEKAQVDYIAATVRSVAANLHRRSRLERRLFSGTDEELFGLPGSAPGPEERVMDEALLELVEETLAELTETDRLLLMGKYVEGLDDNELARRVGVKPSAVRMRLTRAKQRARSIMKRKEGGGVDQRQEIRPYHV